MIYPGPILALGTLSKENGDGEGTPKSAKRLERERHCGGNF